MSNKTKRFHYKKIISTILLTTLATFAITVGEVPKEVVIENNNGGRIDGSAWSSSMLKDKVYVMFFKKRNFI